MQDIKIDGESVLGKSNPSMAVTEITNSSGNNWWGNWFNKNTKKFRVTLSSFEESQWQDLKKYMEWSGNVVFYMGDDLSSAVVIEEEEEKTYNISDALFADFIKPEISVSSSHFNGEGNDSLTLKIQATDKYYTPGQALDANKIMLLVDNEIKDEDDGVTISYGTPEVLIGTRNGSNSQYGILQDVTITGLSQFLGRGVKLRLSEDTVHDLSGNKNVPKDISLFNTLRVAKSSSGVYESSTTSGFLGNSSIQRQNIQSVTFLNSTATAPSTGTWDVSATEDNSIIAWYSNSKVYIASDYPIYANVDSSYLFSYIGYASGATSGNTIENLDLLSTTFTTNMQYMFRGLGYATMTSFALGDNFETSRVTNMEGMFQDAGNKLTSFTIGQRFETSNVSNMKNMFNNFGSTSLTTLNLGNRFTTQNVTNMDSMFYNCGKTAMTKLDLGPAFTKIADAHTNIFANTGKSGANIYAGSAIYLNKNAFRLNANSTTTTGYTVGTVVPKYKPTWSKTDVTFDESEKSLTIKVAGQVDSSTYGDAIKTVTNNLTNGTADANSTKPFNVKVAGQEANDITKKVTMSKTGPSSTVSANIILTDFEQSVLQSGKSYLEWSGKTALQIAEGTLVDSYGNPNLTQSDESGTMTAIEIKDADSDTTSKNTNGKMFADFVRPATMYDYSKTTINKTSKTVTIEFSITDKYFAKENLGIEIGAANRMIVSMDGTDLAQTHVNMGLAKTPITENGTTIGYKYVLTLTELEQDAIAVGKNYLDYSGPVIITIPKGSMTDNSGNTNPTKTISVGPGNNILKPDENETTNIDLVNPTWTADSNNISFDFTTGTATVIVKATDKYFKSSTLTKDNITVYLGNTAVTSGITKTVSAATALKETRMVNGVATEIQYGNQYTVTVTGITLNSDQGKLRIAAGTATDTSGNTSEAKDIVLYNRLKSASTETSATSSFLGNDQTKIPIQRQNIENVTFESYISSDIYNHTTNKITDDTRAWDVSAAGDQSIIAWYEETRTGVYIVHIGSEGGILANRTSDNLFKYIGYSNKCQETQVITNIKLLDVSTVISMNNMFAYTGYNAMTSLDLGPNFDTSKVTNMAGMFTSTGENAMTTLNLQNKFNTAIVTDMSNMFERTGYMAMTSLNLGTGFNTSKVTNMANMFQNTGYTAMTSLNLGTGFNTTNVTNMANMFQNTGYAEMTSLNLGSAFNTAKVTNMSYMFNGTASSKMTKLSLEGNFYTTAVTNMTSMFQNCGIGSMTELDLGPAFTNIAATNTNMFTECGQQDNIKIYVGSAIYSGEHELRLGADLTTKISFTRGTIIPKYRPQWKVETTAPNKTNSEITVTLKGTVDSANYNGYNSNVINKFSNTTTSQITVSIDGTENNNITKTISGASSTPATNVQCSLKLEGFKETRRAINKYTEWSGNIALEIAQATLVDSYGNPNLKLEEDKLQDSPTGKANATGKLFLDSIAPEFTYEHAETEINHESKKVTVYFSVTDKYFNKIDEEKLPKLADGSYNSSSIALKLLDTNTTIPNDDIKKTLTRDSEIYETINGQNQKVGEKFKLVIEGLDQGDGIYYSGPMAIALPEGMAEDYSGTKSSAKTITIGVDDPENDTNHKNQEIVDVVSPIWTVQNMNITQDASGKTNATMELIGKDKYLDKERSKELLTSNSIKVMVDGVDISGLATELSKSLSEPEEITNGLKYTLTISNLEESYDAFISARNEGKRVYREYSGDVSIEIPEETLIDNYGNKSSKLTIGVGEIDTLKPEIVKVSSSIDKTAKTETIVFDVTDKYYSTILDDQTLLSKLHVFIDSENADTITKQIANVETLTATIDGVERTVGKRYTLVLSDFEQAGLQEGYQFKGLSGTVSVDIEAGIATDTKGNTSNETTLKGDFVDVIEPSMVYKYTKTVEGAKSVDIVFDVTDKYYSSGDLTLADLTIKMQNGTDLGNYIDMKNIPGAKLTLSTPTNIISTKAINKTVNGEIKTGLTNQVVGRRYTLTISGLEQSKIADGAKYLEYSGNVTIAVTAGKIKDTSNNGNLNKTLTFGIDLPDETGTKENLDIVSPVWAVDSQTVDLDNQEATIVVTATDKYFRESTLTNETLELWINGQQVEKNGTTGRNLMIEKQEEMYEDWIESGNTSKHLVGVKYTIKASGFDIDEGQVKIKIPAGTIKDYSGNQSKELEFMLYSCLKATNTETLPTSGFLGNNSIQRQNIESVTFVSGLSSIVSATKWDVSAGNDGSIMAWYTTNSSNGALNVYIGGTTAIFANPDSSYLFANIGSASKCTATEVVKGLNLVTTKRVTNMNHMFYNTGANAMTSLDLGTNFNTESVKDMSHMFDGCGKNNMSTLNLRDKFKTIKVTDMSYMFANAGSKLITLDVSCFDTSTVTQMQYMFQNTGAQSLTSLKLGENFNTAKVTDMSYMFNGTANASSTITKISLGKQFYATSVTNMTSMFQNCGATHMTELDLGPAFTKIAETNTNIFANTGNTGCIINAPEAIYKDSKNFRIGGEGSTAIAYSRGTINAKYRTEWAIDSTTVDKTTKKVEITLRGKINSQTTVAEYPADMVSGITDKNKIKVFIDNTELTNVEQSMELGNVSYDINNSGKVEVLQKITLTDFEETARQSGKSYKEWSGNITLKILQDSGLVENYGNQNTEQTLTDVAFVDFIKPEITYNYSTTDINYTEKTLTVEFSIIDKYFASSTITENNLTVKLLDTNAVPENITKTLTSEEIKEVRNDKTETIGKKYKLVVGGLEQASKTADGKYKDYSGPIGIGIAEGTVKDTSNNVNDSTTITVGVDEPDKSGSEEIVDVVDPIWEAKNIQIDKVNKKVTVDLYGTDKYYSRDELDVSKIKVFVDGTEITSSDEVLKTLSDVEILSEERQYGSIQYGVKYTLTLSNWTESDMSFASSNREYREYSGITKIQIAEGTIYDNHNTNKQQEFTLGKVDFIKPDIIYKTSNTVIDKTNKTLTVVFDATDKYYNSSASSLALSDLTVTVGGKTMTQAELTASGNSLTSTALASGYGTRYTLVIKNLQQNPNTGIDYSGIVSIAIPKDKISDLSGNKNDAKTITVGIDTPSINNEGQGTIVDVVDPAVRAENVIIDEANNMVIVDVVGTDKYIDVENSSLNPSDIKVFINGEDIEKTAGIKVEKNVSSRKVTNSAEGNPEIRYTVTLSNFKENDETFLSARADGTRWYREYSGAIKIEIPANQLVDTSGNTNKATTLDLGQVDKIKPDIVKYSSTIDKANKKETIVFDVVDKYLKTTGLGTTVTEANNNLSKLHVYVDDESADNITKNITKVDKLTATIGGKTGQIVGYRYTLELTEFEKTKNSKGYKDLSGTVRVDVDAGIGVDTSNNASEATSITGDFVDFINPYLEYTHQSSDINTSNKTYTMKFRITDKYYTSGKLTLDDLTVKIKNGQLKNGSEIEYNLSELAKAGTVTMALSSTDINATNVKLTNADTGYVQNVETVLIGHEYTLTVSNLEKLQIASGMTTADYSGIITVGIKGNVVKDRTSGGSQNGNIAKTITSGVNVPSGTGNGTIVDVVDPLITGLGTVADPTKGTATLRFSATDTYFNASSITSANIKIFVNGEEKTVGVASGDGITKTLTTKDLTETRRENGKDTTVKYGIEYTLNITGYPSNIDQLKVVIPQGMVTDKTGNGNKEKAFNLFNTLTTAEANASETSAFLGNTYGIKRGKISQIVFENYIGGTSATRWDVSAQKDGSIMAWYNTNEISNGTYIIHIGSETVIGANVNSSYWFSYIGKDSACTATDETSNPIIKNLSAVSFGSVTNMSYMFADLGYSNMTTFSLGSNFYTTSAENMSGMFSNTGFSKMTSINLGTNFDTSKVTNMSAMFKDCGRMELTSLNLGDNFDTSKVIDMDAMFYCVGFAKLQTLTLGSKFDTSNVTNMSSMFVGVGQVSQLTTLNLGTKFNTSKVTNMAYMFHCTGTNALTKLDLGDLFYTTKVTNMEYMFDQTGTTAMATLDLGPAFTKIASSNTNFDSDLGKSGCVVYAPEAIYQDSTNFRLGGEGSTAIAYARGTIEPKYRTEWALQTTAFDKTAGSLAVTLKGRTNSTVATSEYKSDVSTGITNKAKVKVYIDGTELTGVNINLGTVSQTTNSTTSTKEVLQEITISNFTEYSGNITLKILQDSGLKDTYGIGSQNIEQSFTTTNVDKNTAGSLFADFVKPEITYIYAPTDIDKTNKTLTVEFSVTDKYFASSKLITNTNGTLTANQTEVNKITIAMKDNANSAVNSKVTKKITEITAVTGTVDGKTAITGYKFKLVISGLQQETTDGKYKDYSGPISIAFPAGIGTDKSTNTSEAKTITIGVNTDGSGSQVNVDVVDPIWKTEKFNIDNTNKKITVDLIGTDKYIDTENSNLTTNDITVTVDGEEASSIKKELSAKTSVDYGIKYTLTLSEWEQSSLQDGKKFLEWSGTTKIKIASGTLRDLPQQDLPNTVTKKYNTSKEQTFTLGHVDFIKPKIEIASATKNATAGTETIVINAIDKYIDTANSSLTVEDISVYVDNVSATGLTKKLTKGTDLTATVNGNTQTIGQQYTLVLSNFKQTRTSIDSAKNYSEWSGTVSIDVAEGKIKDTNNTPNVNDKIDKLAADFVDFIRPEITYKYSASDIDYGNKTFTMDFEITDKYINTITELTTANLTNYLTIKVDGVDITNNKNVTKEIVSSSDVTAGTTEKPINKTIDGVIKTGLTNQVIGKHYKLKLSNLQQAIKTGNTLDYSGVITVALKGDVMAKDTSNNGNTNATITSGVNLPGGSGNGTIVDVVDPMWEQIGRATVEAGQGKANMVIRGTDKYLNKLQSTLNVNNVIVRVNGEAPKTDVKLTMTEDTSVNLAYAKQYNVSLTGFDPAAYQVSFTIPAGVLMDNYGNTSEEREFILFSSLREATTETEATSPFLGNTDLQRQNIEQIIFEEHIKDGDSTLWDVSATQDRTILAWYEKNNTTGKYIVHIGTTIIMNSNVNSTNLFNYIAYSSGCVTTSEASNKIIKNLELLHVDNVKNMTNMFAHMGYKSMQTFGLGDSFDTGKVENMEGMFNETGFEQMTSINLGAKFNTSSAKNMNSMFASTGHDKMQSLSLGESFDTSSVTTMNNMFANTGFTKMTKLDLGPNFNTSNVQSMNSMFLSTGHNSMKSLDLGDKFYTTAVTDMTRMFYGTGASAMTTLDLGAVFTKIADTHDEMFTNCGVSSLVVYAPELIYSNETSFKLGR